MEKAILSARGWAETGRSVPTESNSADTSRSISADQWGFCQLPVVFVPYWSLEIPLGGRGSRLWSRTSQTLESCSFIPSLMIDQAPLFPALETPSLYESVSGNLAPKHREGATRIRTDLDRRTGHLADRLCVRERFVDAVQSCFENTSLVDTRRSHDFRWPRGCGIGGLVYGGFMPPSDSDEPRVN
jgi:hypothetical protein